VWLPSERKSRTKPGAPATWIQQLLQLRDRPADSGISLQFCRLCWSDLRKDKLPALCILNGLDLDEVPAALQDLNMIEKLLVQLTKVFLTIIRLKPYTFRGPSSDLSRAMTGLAVHLLLTHEATHD
jgi:hypothetical protein